MLCEPEGVLGGVTEGNNCCINPGRNCSILSQVDSRRLRGTAFCKESETLTHIMFSINRSVTCT